LRRALFPAGNTLSLGRRLRGIAKILAEINFALKKEKKSGENRVF